MAEMRSEDFTFDGIKEKVDYIKYFNDQILWTVLFKDEALTTMLIDMINKEKYGKDAPSIVTNGEIFNNDDAKTKMDLNLFEEAELKSQMSGGPEITEEQYYSYLHKDFWTPERIAAHDLAVKNGKLAFEPVQPKQTPVKSDILENDDDEKRGDCIIN
tara:strand:+ start:3742 stop:4215 length:474 start_codon:yes stop_codon:yes gene_type:complete